MKRIATIVLLTIAFYAEAQAEKPEKYTWGLNIDQQITAYYNYFPSPLSLFATLTKNRHQFEFGPRYYLGQYKPGYKFGLGFQYKFYPNGHNQRFNSYLIPSLIFRYGIEERGSVVNDIANQTLLYGDKDITMAEILFGAGYGLELKLSNKLYLASDARILFGFGNRTTKEVYNTNPSFNNSKSDDYYHINWQIGLNIGYRF